MIKDFFEKAVAGLPKSPVIEALAEDERRCYQHNSKSPCQQCAVNERRGYAVLQMAGRCSNGAERDAGSRWHAVPIGKHIAICGAKPGRYSAGWSFYERVGQDVTCPRCVKKLRGKERL